LAQWFLSPLPGISLEYANDGPVSRRGQGRLGLRLCPQVAWDGEYRAWDGNDGDRFFSRVHSAAERAMAI